MNKLSKVIVFLLLFGVGMVLGWYTSDKLSNKDKTVKFEEKTIVETENGNDYNIKKAEDNYATWINYILKNNITEIKIYKQILDVNDSNFKDNENGLYYIDISKEELKDLFKTMENSSLGIVTGLGGTADYVLIKYNKNNVNYSVTITNGGLIFTEGNDEELLQILKDSIKEEVSKMNTEEQALLGENAVANVIRNWNGENIYKYFQLHDAKVMYYPQ